MKKTIKIKFSGFWPEFQENNNFIYNTLKKKYDVILSDSPEYLFSSCFSDEYLKYDCVRIFYTGENLCPDFNLFDYAIGYEYIDFGDRYLRFPNYAMSEVYGKDVDLMLKKHLNNENILKDKPEFCSFVVSKGEGYVAKEREAFFYLLSKYKKVESGGRFLNNIGCPEGIQDKLLFQMKHKFSIAFENSSHEGYSTEKIVQSFAAKTIPIYWGDPQIGRIFNENAFVNCNAFNSFNEIVKKIKEIDSDNELFMKMMSAPALNDMSYVKKCQSDLQLFLENIIDTDIENGYRRDTVGYGKKKEDELKDSLKRKKKTIWNMMGLR